MGNQRKQFTVNVNANLLQQLRDLSKDTDIPLSRLIDRAIRLLLDSYEIKHD